MVAPVAWLLHAGRNQASFSELNDLQVEQVLVKSSLNDWGSAGEWSSGRWQSGSVLPAILRSKPGAPARHTRRALQGKQQMPCSSVIQRH